MGGSANRNAIEIIQPSNPKPILLLPAKRSVTDRIAKKANSYRLSISIPQETEWAGCLTRCRKRTGARRNQVDDEIRGARKFAFMRTSLAINSRGQDRWI
jgi:hypothetical protein